MSERIDNIGFKNYKLIQDTDGFCYGIDAVLLAHFSPCRADERVLDLCCGNGAVSLVIEAKYAPERLFGLDIQEDQVNLANRSAQLNGLSDKMDFVCGDVLAISDYFDAESFDLVVCNPPYFKKGSGIACDAGGRQLARHEGSAGIADFIKAASYVLKKGGRMTLIHRPSRLADIIEQARVARMEPKIMQFVAPHPGEAPNMVLIQLVKGGGEEIKMLPELVVRNANGEWSEQIDAIYER